MFEVKVFVFELVTIDRSSTGTLYFNGAIVSTIVITASRGPPVASLYRLARCLRLEQLGKQHALTSPLVKSPP